MTHWTEADLTRHRARQPAASDILEAAPDIPSGRHTRLSDGRNRPPVRSELDDHFALVGHLKRICEAGFKGWPSLSVYDRHLVSGFSKIISLLNADNEGA